MRVGGQVTGNPKMRYRTGPARSSMMETPEAARFLAFPFSALTWLHALWKQQSPAAGRASCGFRGCRRVVTCLRSGGEAFRSCQALRFRAEPGCLAPEWPRHP